MVFFGVKMRKTKPVNSKTNRNEVKKMKEIEFLQLLLDDAKQELDNKKLFDELQKVANRGTKGAYERWMKMRSPSIARIEDNLKMIRRISIQLERKLRNEQ